MIVIGTEVVENYLADHAGHKGIKGRSQYEAWLDIVNGANWRIRLFRLTRKRLASFKSGDGGLAGQ